MKKVMRMCLSVFMAVIMLFGNCSFAAIGNLLARNTYLELEKANINSIKKVIDENKIFFDTNFNTAREEVEIYGENLPGDFNNLKLKAIGETDIKNKYYYGKASLGSMQDDKLSFEMLLKDNKLMIQVPELYNKHVSVDFSKLKEICEKFEIEVTDEEINGIMNIISNPQEGSILSKQDEAYLKKVAPKYVKKLSNLVEASHFTMNNKARIEYNNKFIDCKSVSYEVTVKEILRCLCEILKDIKNDEKLVDIIILVFDYNGEFDIEKEEIVSGIDSLASGIEEELKTDDFDGIKLISTLYYNTKKDILKRELKVANVFFDEEESISLTTIKNDYYELDLGEVKIKDNIIKTDKMQHHSIDIISEGINYDYDYYTEEIIEIPYTKTESFNILVETPDKNNTIITFSKDDMPEKLIIKVKENVSTNKKLGCNFEFILDTNEVDYKVFVNYLIEKDVKLNQKSFNNQEIDIYKMSKEELLNEVQNNQEKVSKKAEEIIRELFPETIKAAEERERQMNVREDYGVLVEKSYANYAWGQVYNGTVICNNGEIYEFDGRLDKVDVLRSENIKKKIKTVSEGDLRLIKEYITRIEEIYEERHVGYDMGSFFISIYSNDKEIVLRQTGDWEIINTSKYTGELLQIINKYL